MASPPKLPDRLFKLLNEIADALGVSVGRFYEGQSPVIADDAFQLLHLYGTVLDDEGRQWVMTVALREAERCRGTDQFEK